MFINMAPDTDRPGCKAVKCNNDIFHFLFRCAIPRLVSLNGANLPTSVQPVHLSLSHPGFAHWPQCLPGSRSLWSPSLAGGSVAAACRRCPCQHTVTPGNEPPSPSACRGWGSRWGPWNEQGLRHFAQLHHIFTLYHAGLNSLPVSYLL